MPNAEEIEKVARCIHANYLEHQADLQDPDGHPAMRPWDDLSDELRGQNIQQARNNIVKLASLGKRVRRAGPDTSSAEVPLAPEQMEELAMREHDRWAAEKRRNGYVYGEVRCDDPPNLTHPDLVTWEELSEASREKDREPMRRMIGCLWVAGFTIIDDDTGAGAPSPPR